MPKTVTLPQRSCPRVIVGIDPGVALVGYAFLSEERALLTLLSCGVISTPAHTPLEERLCSIYDQINELLPAYHPDSAAMETLFFGKNKKTALQVSQARGVILLALRQYGLPIAQYGPSEVKMALTGSGRAKKPQVGEMVRVLLSLPTVPKPDDAADAAAIAICHAQNATWCSQQERITQR